MTPHPSPTRGMLLTLVGCVRLEFVEDNIMSVWKLELAGSTICRPPTAVLLDGLYGGG